jgi:mono/diheme cytochrome c family protein
MALAWTLRARSGQPSAQIQRGKYLVESVAMCGDCHKPRNEKGEPIQEKWLHGSPLPFKPAVPIPAWADKTPKIAGLPGWEDNDAIRFLMTGLAYNDLPARPPMPQYRLTREEATAVVAYLRSLTPEQKIEPDEQIASSTTSDLFLHGRRGRCRGVPIQRFPINYWFPCSI